MTRTQWKDALRNIGKQKVSYLSIAIIALLGVTMFLGMNYSAAAIDTNGTAFYNGVNYRDIEIVSTRLLSPADREVLSGIEGVRDVEGVLMTQGKVSSGSIRKDVAVITVTERINRPILAEGRLPEAPEECAVEQSLMDQMGWQVGDRIEIADGEGQTALFLTGKAFLVTGAVVHPDHICGSVPDTPYVLVVDDAFDLDLFSGCSMKVEILVDAPRTGSRFEGPYEDAVKKVLRSIEAISDDRAAQRQAEVDDQLRQAAEDSLTLNWDLIEDAKEGVRQAVRDAMQENMGEGNLDIPWAQKQTVDLSDHSTSAMTLWLTDTVSANLRLSLRENVGTLVESLELQDSVLRLVFSALDGQGEYTPQAANDLLVDAVMPALAEYEDEYEELVRACTTWDETFESFLDGTLWEQIGLPGICRWIVTDVHGNMSFVQLSSSRDSLTRLEMTFSLLFIAVGALVIYATVSKMIDEQRSLVGATKALGFYRREIFAKYLLFGVSATALGTLAGALVARFAVEPFILKGYQMYYSASITRGALTATPTLIVFGAGLLLSVTAVWFACRRLLRTPAVALLQSAMPKGRKRAETGKPSRLPLYSRLILRNVRTDIRRVIVTIVSVAGCCALVVVGFTLRHAVNGAVDHQFSDIVHYDGLFRFDPKVNGEAELAVTESLRAAGADACPVLDTYCTVRVRNLDVQELMCGDLNAMGTMFRLSDARTGEPLAVSEEGIYIPKRFSEYFGVGQGDTLEITINSTETVQAPVAGVFNNYMNRIMFMSDGCFKALFGREPVNNAVLTRLNGVDAEKLDDTFAGISGYGGYTPADTMRKLFETATAVMAGVVALFIFMAAIMAGVVLMNLTNIYILQKKRELTVMRVNGFTTREVIAYVTRETVFTTVLGILLGVGLGAGLGYAIVRALEQPFIQFDRSVSLSAWLVGVGMTALFTFIVNAVVLKKVRHLKLTDAA